MGFIAIDFTLCYKTLEIDSPGLNSSAPIIHSVLKSLESVIATRPIDPAIWTTDSGKLQEIDHLVYWMAKKIKINMCTVVGIHTAIYFIRLLCLLMLHSVCLRLFHVGFQVTGGQLEPMHQPQIKQQSQRKM